MKFVLREAKTFLVVGQSYGKYKHVLLSLREMFKGHNGESHHLVAVTAKTNLGLQIGSLIRRVLDWREKKMWEEDFCLSIS